MKNKLSILFVLLSTIVLGQITEQIIYTGSAGLSKVNTTDYNYYYFDANGFDCLIFNTLHQQIASIPIALESDQTLYSITYLSEELFDLDSGLELLYTYTYWQQVDTTWYIYYHSKIVDKSGAIILDLPGAQYTNVTKVNEASVLMAWIYDYSLSSYPLQTLVYSLPGNYSGLSEDKNTEQGIKVWPNPASQNIYLPIDESTISIRIINGNGTIIDQINSSNKDILEYSVNHLSAGLYIYEQLNTKGEKKTQKFMIH